MQLYPTYQLSRMRLELYCGGGGGGGVMTAYVVG